MAQKFLKQFWWARGVVAAMALLSLIGPLLELKRYELLRIFHAMIVGWTEFLTVVTRLLASVVPFFVHPLAANVLILALSSALPLYFISFKKMAMFDLKSVRRSFLVPLSAFLFSSAAFILALILAHTLGEVAKNETILFEIDGQFDAFSEQFNEYLEDNKDGESTSAQPRYFRFCVDADKSYWDTNDCFVAGFTNAELITLSKSDQPAKEVLDQFHQAAFETVNRIYTKFLPAAIVILMACVSLTSHFESQYRLGLFHFAVFLITIEVLYFLPLIGEVLKRAADKVLAEA